MGERNGNHPAVLALDFDGVIADALEECALVTWLGIHPYDTSIPGPTQLAAVPPEFLERFRRIRDYSRLLDHFVVAHLPEAATVASQADFDRLYEALDPSYVRKFTQTATAARDRLRTQESDFWLDLHTLYPGIDALLRRFGGSVVVVTAKDADSVRAILGRHGLGDTVAEIFGETGAKAEAVQDVSTRWGVPLDRFTFIDDNLTNAVRVGATGAHSRWAQWGYQTPEHRAEAARLAVVPLELAEVASLTPAAPAVTAVTAAV
ncbi:HAD family hydrolase [Streptomyces sp. NPDC094032]|uniref:HAD family hydrolase n=1 Tax=Streptomyces sp. NPDC094032 TaxID=3155308 RepID=UPI00332F4DE6